MIASLSEVPVVMQPDQGGVQAEVAMQQGVGLEAWELRDMVEGPPAAVRGGSHVHRVTTAYGARAAAYVTRAPSSGRRRRALTRSSPAVPHTHDTGQ